MYNLVVNYSWKLQPTTVLLFHARCGLLQLRSLVGVAHLKQTCRLLPEGRQASSHFFTQMLLFYLCILSVIRGKHFLFMTS